MAEPLTSNGVMFTTVFLLLSEMHVIKMKFLKRLSLGSTAIPNRLGRSMTNTEKHMG